MIGISTKPLAMQRWFLTAHLRASITCAAKHMFGLNEDKAMGHKEEGTHRMTRDESDVQSVIQVFSETMIDSFIVKPDEKRLINISTATVQPDDVTESLLLVEARATDDMKDFIEQRIITTQVSFFVNSIHTACQFHFLNIVSIVYFILSFYFGRKQSSIQQKRRKC